MIHQLHRALPTCYHAKQVHVPHPSFALLPSFSMLARTLWTQSPQNSTSQIFHFSETSHFIGDNADLENNTQSASTLSAATLLQWCGNVKSLTLGMLIHDCSIRHGLESDSAVHGKLVQMYSRCGDVNGAHALFCSKAEERNVFVWNVLIRAYAHLGQCQVTFNLFNQMLCEGIFPDNFTVVCVLTACSCQVPPTAGHRIHASIVVDAFITEHLIMNALLNMYRKSRSLEDVRRIFTAMLERNIVAWTAMIDALLHYGCQTDALQSLCHMQGEGVFPDRVFLLTIISACTESLTLYRGKQLHVSMLEMGYESDAFLRTALVNMYGNCGILESARKVFKEPFEQNVVLWNSFISLHAQCGFDDDALQHSNRMLHEGMLPDRVTFLHGLSACANKGDLFEGRKIHVLSLNVLPGLDVMLGTSIVYMYGKCGQLDAAWQAFQQSRVRSVVSWNVMLGVLIQHGEFRKAFHHFATMQIQGVLPDKFTFIHVLEACLSLEVLTEGEQVHSYAVEMGVESDIIVGTGLVNMYNKCSGLEAACTMFEALPERNVVSWNCIIMAHVQRGKYRNALQLFAQMHVKEITPDSSTLSSIIDACVSESLFDDAVLIHMYITESGYGLDNTNGTALIIMYGKLGILEDAVAVFKMLQARDVLLWTAMLTAYLWSGNCEEVLRLYPKLELEGLTTVKATYLVVLEACTDIFEPARVEELFISLTKKGLDVDAAVATALVNMYGKSGGLGIGRRIFDSVPAKDVILWTAMITTYAQSGHGKEAVCLFAEMQDLGFVPNRVTFVNMLAACSHSGLVQEGYYFLASMLWDYSMSPLVDHYDCAIDLFGRAGLLDEAEHLIDRMPFLPRIVSFMALLGACRYQADLERGARIAKRVFDLDLESSAPYVMLSNITFFEGSTG